MTGKFARFAALKTLSLQDYERLLRLAGERRELADNLQLRKYVIDDYGAYLRDDRSQASTAKFARFAIREALPLRKYARRLRRTRRHRKRFDDLELRRYLIDDNGVYFLDDNHVVIEHNGITTHTPDEQEAACDEEEFARIAEAYEASVEVHAPREAGLDTRDRGKMNELMKVSTAALILYGLGALWLGLFMAQALPLGLPSWAYLVGAVVFVLAAELVEMSPNG